MSHDLVPVTVACTLFVLALVITVTSLLAFSFEPLTPAQVVVLVMTCIASWLCVLHTLEQLED